MRARVSHAAWRAHQRRGATLTRRPAHGLTHADLSCNRPPPRRPGPDAGAKETQRARRGRSEGHQELPPRRAGQAGGLLPEGLELARLGHAEPPRAHLQSRLRAHPHARDRPRLLPGSDRRPRARRREHPAAAALRQRTDVHPRDPPHHHPPDARERSRAARERRPEHPEGAVERAARHRRRGRGAPGRGRDGGPGLRRRRVRDPVDPQHDPPRRCGPALRHPDPRRHRGRQGHEARRALLPAGHAACAPSWARTS